MEPTQVRRAGSRSSHPAQIYVNHDEWERFADVARALDVSRSARVRELIRRDIERHDTNEASEGAWEATV